MDCADDLTNWAVDVDFVEFTIFTDVNADGVDGLCADELAIFSMFFFSVTFRVSVIGSDVGSFSMALSSTTWVLATGVEVGLDDSAVEVCETVRTLLSSIDDVVVWSFKLVAERTAIEFHVCKHQLLLSNTKAFKFKSWPERL